ncbi:MAG TPA: CmcI family methyltransferase [Gaiellaceae bacterium]|nr:CmcI family methyltransferase [Gaiellaceae bacterium]
MALPKPIRRAVMTGAALPAALRVRRFVRTDPGFDASWAFIRETFKPGWDCGLETVQVREEIERLWALAREEGVRSVLEVGTAAGGTLFLLAAAAADGATLVTLDLPHPRGYRRHRGPIYRSFARRGQRIVTIRASSHDPATVERVRAELRGQPLDLLFIDGDHSRASVTRDYELYRPLVRPGGLVAFHDIVPGPPDGPGDVPAFWQELKAVDPDAETHEFVSDWGQGGFGIGVLRLPVS